MCFGISCLFRGKTPRGALSAYVSLKGVRTILERDVNVVCCADHFIFPSTEIETDSVFGSRYSINNKSDIQNDDMHAGAF